MDFNFICDACGKPNTVDADDLPQGYERLGGNLFRLRRSWVFRNERGQAVCGMTYCGDCGHQYRFVLPTDMDSNV